jgi:hypothetical protein
MSALLTACSYIFPIILPAISVADPRLNQVLTAWEKDRQGIRSLAVDFKYTRNGGSRWAEMYVGRFKLLKTAQGEIMASFALYRPLWISVEVNYVDALLYKGRIYLLDHQEKTACVFTPSQDLTRFLENYFNPFAAFLDQQQLQEKYRLTIGKQDEWYTYLNVEPKRSGSVHTLQYGRVALMQKSTGRIAKGLPRQLWYTSGGTEHTFDIRQWRQNAVDGPKLEDFTPPEERPGWTVKNMD